ncbi:ABC transporter substrate-binding protein [Castellaniella sp. S9]|uniref:ABC transporter substrate-binding protein n=1 Tax=Castellaniella sp. S9 TaxID=2993652 RepID=UPI0022B57A92|nr:ABC transporter substrate-binding protein [Castellaniella sp. S9]
MIRNLLKAGLGLALTAAMLGAAPAQAQDKPKDDVTLMLNWYLYSEHAPFFLGKKLGYYADEGINLDIQEGRGSAVTAQAVAAKSVNFGYIDVTTMIKAAAKGAPLISTGVLFQLSPMSVMGFEEKGIKTPQQIIGKTVAVTPGDSMSQMWPIFLKANNIDPSQINIVSGDAQTKLNAVMTGRADMLLGYVMDQAIKLQDATGKVVHPIRFADSGVNQISSGIIVNKDWLAANEDLARRFMRASTRAVEATVKDPQAAVDAMLEAKPKAGVSETLLVGLQRSIELYHTKDTEGQAPFRVAMDNVDKSLDLLVEYGGVDPAHRGTPADYVTLDYLPKN